MKNLLIIFFLFAQCIFTTAQILPPTAKVCAAMEVFLPALETPGAILQNSTEKRSLTSFSQNSNKPNSDILTDPSGYSLLSVAKSTTSFNKSLTRLFPSFCNFTRFEFWLPEPGKSDLILARFSDKEVFDLLNCPLLMSGNTIYIKV